MGYIENPKTKDSGIICCIPQKGVCPNKCEDCFFQSGRSYLEPLDKNLPNMPSLEEVGHRVVRVNDGNDSNNDQERVIKFTKDYPLKFYNTAIPKDLEKFDAPVVLTVNPADMTDNKAHLIEPPVNLMFVRVRTNAWNMSVVDKAVRHYTEKKVPVVLTYMAYYTETVKTPEFYEWKKRTTNSYWVLKDVGRESIEDLYIDNSLVYSCGYKGTHACSRCGNCLREFFTTMERMKT